MAQAVRSVGGQQEFADWLAERTAKSGYQPGRSAIGHWVQGRGDPPTWVTFLVARELAISVDEFVLSDEEQQTLRQQVRELRQDVAIMKQGLQDLLAIQGKPPIEFPREAASE